MDQPGDLIAVMEMSFFIIGIHLNVFLFEYLPFQFVLTFLPSVIVACRMVLTNEKRNTIFALKDDLHYLTMDSCHSEIHVKFIVISMPFDYVF